MDFDKEAGGWDAEPRRVKLAHNVADAMIRELQPAPDQDVLDFGCGTGLVTLKLQPSVRSITGVDSSSGMLGVLEQKVQRQGLTNVHPRLIDFDKGGQVAGRFHLIVSSMTLHHVANTAALLRLWFELLRPGGRLGVADLDTEDGSFHGDNNDGVYHLGFDRSVLQALLEEAGFGAIQVTTAASVIKQATDQGLREYSVFLITGTKIGRQK